ncbi:MAG: hypothetical protein HON53_01140 [Planctomycetaceae bacterium]|jgi:hypothetical protein|nr:hypothetical protein [Planctomycetaceae bacterium]MBT6153999.1 hypothetical protein [Planctomycetaceae bacterium]MBT6494444.1 hypothetical protein [Planctomycetaceae bacterium]
MRMARTFVVTSAGLMLIGIGLFAAPTEAADPRLQHAPARKDALLYRKVAIPKQFLATVGKRTFGGDIRIGDLDGDGRCDFLVYRCNHGAPSGAHVGGVKPAFLGAFDIEGKPLWQAGKGGNQPSRPMSVAIHDMLGDRAAEVICFWHRPDPAIKADWQSLADVVVQIRDGRTGKVLRQAAPKAITERRRKDPVGANWIHQRLLIANFRGTNAPRDVVVKLGDTYVALDERLDVLWTYQTKWTRYSQCPAYIPSVGDIDGDGRDELNGGYFVIDHDGKPLWENKLGDNMDSVAITEWDNGQMRAICSGFGHVMDHRGRTIVGLGRQLVPHGQEVRVADFLADGKGPEMIIRYNGHKTDVCVVSSDSGTIVDRFKLNFSPTNVGMESVFWNGPDKPALLYNGSWLWDVKQRRGWQLPGLPPPNGNDFHRMGFHHMIPANLCGDRREELVIWDPTAKDIYIYSPKPFNKSEYTGYRAGPRQYNPRLMD